MDVGENGQFWLNFVLVPNIPNYLERFYRTQDLYSFIPNILTYRLILRSLKLTNNWQSYNHFFKISQGNLKFSLAIY